jgi:hypothetical protein
LEFGYDRISKLQDRVLTPFGFDAPGNIGTGTRRFVSATVDAPLAQLWKGLRVKASSTLQRTRVADPTTGEQRAFSGFYPAWQWQLELRRDAGAFAYGFTLFDRDAGVTFRTDEIQRNYNEGLFGIGFVEYRADGRTTATLNAENLWSTAGIADRFRFDPNRRPGASRTRDFRYRQPGLKLALTVRRTFGSSAKAAVGAK